ncbi:MAG: hypothetical protein JSS00_09505 [Proteobacteria bacterium]|nr:hypothetical protein [Pseudomonadota bacterium]
MSTQTDVPRGNNAVMITRVFIVIALLGAALFLGAYGTHLARWSDAVAIVVALMCAASALRLAAESFYPDALGARIGVEGPSTAREVRQVRLQAMLLVALAIALVWPVTATWLHWPAPAWAYVVTAAFILVRITYTWVVFARADEFSRQRTRQMGWWIFFAGQTALLAYASAERLGLAPTLTAWDILVLMQFLSIMMAAFLGKARTAA